MTQPNALTSILSDLLVPLLSTGAPASTDRAARAAREAIGAYDACDPGELVCITQVIGFGLAALDDLSLSTQADLSLPVKLRLRGNASALNRASMRSAAVLERSRRVGEPAADRTSVAPEPPAPEPSAPQPVPVPGPAEDRNRHRWANAMANVAAELQSRLPQVPHAQRKSDHAWINVLTDVAGELRQPDPAPRYPGLGKTELFRTTLMASGGVPVDLFARPGTARPRR